MIASRHSQLFKPSTATVTTAASGSRKYLYLTVCSGNMLALCVGIAMAWSSPFVPKLVDEDNLGNNPLGRVVTKEEASWIASLLAVGGMFGTCLAGIAAAKVGRKKSLLITCVIPLLTSFLLLAFAKSVYLYYVARLLSGLSVSGVFTVVPMYNGEVAEDSIRGLICSSISTFEATGELITYTIGPFLTIHLFSIVSVCILMFATCMIILILPESPYFLISVNNRQGAEISLVKLRSTIGREIYNELDFIQMVVDECKQNRGIMDIFKSKGLFKAQAIALSLTFFQNCSGIMPILFYSQTIFDETGSSLPPEYSAMSIGLVQFLASFITPNVIDKLGRRWMLFISSIGMCITETLLGLYFFFKTNGTDVSDFFWLPVICLIGYVMFYIVGFGPLVWTILGEIFPNNMKSAAASLTLWFWWTLAFLLSRFFKPIGELFGMAVCFWTFAVNCMLAACFVTFYLIETKGKSFQEIQQLLNQ